MTPLVAYIWLPRSECVTFCNCPLQPASRLAARYHHVYPGTRVIIAAQYYAVYPGTRFLEISVPQKDFKRKTSNFGPGNNPKNKKRPRGAVPTGRMCYFLQLPENALPVLPDWSQLVSFCVCALSVSVLFFTLSSSLPVHINRGKHDKHIRKLE